MDLDPLVLVVLMCDGWIRYDEDQWLSRPLAAIILFPSLRELAGLQRGGLGGLVGCSQPVLKWWPATV